MGSWRNLLATPPLVFFASQGILMALTALLGGLALSGRGPRWIRLTLESARVRLRPSAAAATAGRRRAQRQFQTTATGSPLFSAT